MIFFPLIYFLLLPQDVLTLLITAQHRRKGNPGASARHRTPQGAPPHQVNLRGADAQDHVIFVFAGHLTFQTTPADVEDCRMGTAVRDPPRHRRHPVPPPPPVEGPQGRRVSSAWGPPHRKHSMAPEPAEQSAEFGTPRRSGCTARTTGPSSPPLHHSCRSAGVPFAVSAAVRHAGLVPWMLASASLLMVPALPRMVEHHLPREFCRCRDFGPSSGGTIRVAGH